MASVTFQGVNYTWQNASIIMFNIPLIGITKISIKEKQSKTNEYGFGNAPVYRGYGNKEYEATLSVYWDELQKWINATNNGSLVDVPYFDFPMVLGDEKGRVVPQKVIVRGAEFLETNFETSQGDTKIIVDLPLVISGVDWKN